MKLGRFPLVCSEILIYAVVVRRGVRRWLYDGLFV